MSFIENPRRAPRLPVRCEGRIALRPGGFFPSPTGDYGPRGCQVVAPQELPPGTRVFVELRNERVQAPVELAGRVAWMAKSPPWRMGVAFDEGSFRAADSFFARISAAYPGIDTYGRAPDRIPTDAFLAPAMPPEVKPILAEAEALIVRTIGPGLGAGALQERLGAAFDRLALFALLGRRYVAIGAPDPAAASAWERLLPPA
jgi:hypothetical protein